MLIQKTVQLLKSRSLPWIILGVLLGAILLFLFLLPGIDSGWTWSNSFWFGGIILLVFLLAYLILNRFTLLYDQRAELQSRLQSSDNQISRAYQRLEAIFQVGRKFLEAADENEVIELVLKLSVDLSGAKGASFVPLDEHSQPMTASCYGDLPHAIINPWLEYLSSPALRSRCKSCEHHEKMTVSCPLLKGPISGAANIFCIPLRNRDQEFGIFNLYFGDAADLDPQTRSFLGALIDETALALEGVRLRRRELATFRQIQSIRQKTDLRLMLKSFLENIDETLDADIVVLQVQQQSPGKEDIKLTLGDLPDHLLPFFMSVMRGVVESGNPVILGDVMSDPGLKTDLRSFMAAPIINIDRTLIGSLLVGNGRALGYSQRQLAILQIVTGQLSIIVQNSRQVAELEFQAMMEERRRLAREIHDGLAQTLGYLKLQTAQIKGYMERGEYERASETVDQFYSVLSDAYQDARHSIDGLRIGLGENGLQGWLEELIAEFQDISTIPIGLRQVECNVKLEPEVHAQLLRVVQESLSNIRKHSQATQVWIECFEKNGDLCLEIQDDGVGFSAEDVTGPSQHGLRGIRERAELIGADFQVISQPGYGTLVRIQLPLSAAYCQKVTE